MLNDTVGFVIASKTAEIVSAAPAKDFQGQTLRVLEFGVDNCALVLNNEGTALATIEPKDIIKSFKCKIIANLVICDPKLNTLECMSYYHRAVSRKGGYDHIIQQMVIAASLHRGEFCDSILWAKQ